MQVASYYQEFIIKIIIIIFVRGNKLLLLQVREFVGKRKNVYVVAKIVVV